MNSESTPRRIELREAERQRPAATDGIEICRFVGEYRVTLKFAGDGEPIELGGELGDEYFVKLFNTGSAPAVESR